MATSPNGSINSSIMAFVQRFHTLQAQRDKDDELIKDLLIYCEAVERQLREDNSRLLTELNDTQLDLEDSKRSRRDLQQQLNIVTQMMGQSNADADQMRNRNPYIIVLVDGDGMIFNENLIRQGIEGGKTAANALRNSVLEQCSGLTEDIEVMAKVCANITGLSKAMQRDGSISNGEDLRDFTLGFTQGKASFDFVDVGHGKERADSKIKECMRFHLRNHNCKQILLGVSHDAGYAPFLDEVLNHDDRSRVTILEGPPIVRELSSTGLNILNFSNIFRTEKLINRSVPSTITPNTWAGVSSFIPASTNAPLSPSPTINLKNGSSKKSTPVPAPAKLAWNPGPRGLDPPINVNATVLDKIKRRTTSNKLCNNHYLRGPCAKADECCFEHKYPATDEDLKAIAYLTRLNPCTNGQDCEQEYCIYGHHCPGFSGNTGIGTKVEKGERGELVCNTFGCRFGVDGHPPGTVVKNPRKEFERY